MSASNSFFSAQVFSGSSGFSGSGGGGGGAGASVIVSMTAGETLNTNGLVYIAVNNSFGQTAGRVYHCNATYAYASYQCWILGWVTSGVSAGSSVNVQVSGLLGGFSGLTAGSVYYPSTVAGQITLVKPTNAIPVSFAVNSTTIAISQINGIEPGYYNLPAPITVATYGYFAGGLALSYSYGAVATGDRITFTTATTAANTVSNLSANRGYVAGVSDKTTYGYFAGGTTYAVISAAVSTADQITFSSGATAASTTSNLTNATFNEGTVSTETAYGYGYFAGGDTGGWFVSEVSTGYKLIFSTAAMTANTSSNLSLARTGPAGLSDNNVAGYGYFLGGSTNPAGSADVATADRLTNSTGVVAANASSNLTVARACSASISDNTTYGYIAGGSTTTLQAPGVIVVTTDRLTFSSSATSANTTSNLLTATYGGAGCSDGSNWGYVAGGYTTALWATTEQLTFSTNSFAANTSANLSSARTGAAGLSDGAV